jgi:hypothetical protein
MSITLEMPPSVVSRLARVKSLHEVASPEDCGQAAIGSLRTAVSRSRVPGRASSVACTQYLSPPAVSVVVISS